MTDRDDELLNVMKAKQENKDQQNVSVSSEVDVNEGESKNLSDVNSEETDEVVTFGDIVREREMDYEAARLLFGGQDSTVCTYPEGYKPRQAVFACLTCAQETEVNEAGICYGCALHCHDGHDIVELYTKRRFRCDCGNSKFKRKCTLFEEKSSSNVENKYNQNFAGLFCVCKKTYPCDINEDMHQCVVCEDWFHLSHLDEKCAMIAKEREKSAYCFTLLCKNCSSRLPFLSCISEDEVNDDVVCVSTVVEAKEGPFLLAHGFRKRLCRCQKCLDLYDRSDCEFLIDADDDLEAFVKENIEKTKDEKEPDEKALVNELVQVAGRDAAIHVLRGINDLKTTLAEFMQEKAEEGVVITKEHVTSFFDKLKRRRIEEDSSDDI